MGSWARGSAMRGNARHAWLGAAHVATALLAGLLAGCDAFNADLLLPRVAGPNDGPAANMDSGVSGGGGEGGAGSGGGVAGVGGGSQGDAMVPGQDMDAAAHEDADVANDAAADSASDDASADDAGDAASCSPTNGTDYCTGLPALSDAPVIDGVLDCGPQLRPITPSAWNGAAPVPTRHAASFALAHRPDGIYVYIEVRGQTPIPHPSTDPIYCGDAIELYLDADAVIASTGTYDSPGTVQMIAAAPASLAAPNAHAERFVAGATQGAWTSTEYEIAWLDDGYVFEAFVVAADLGLASWSPATALGLDIVIDVGAAAGTPDLRCGLQLGQYFLRVSSVTPSSCGGEPWCDTRAFCVPALL